jgi:glutamyl-tRNA synthetase
MDELISKFSFEHCSKAGAKFAFEKGKWFNHTYLQAKADNELAEMFKPELLAHGVDLSKFSDDFIAKTVGMVKSRITFVKDLWEHAGFFYIAPTTYEAKAVKKRWSAEMPALMTELIEVLKGIEDFSSAAAEPIVLGWITDKGYHMGNVMNAFRLTVVGECKGPHMFDITELLGKDETIRRIQAGIERIHLDEPAV